MAETSEVIVHGVYSYNLDRKDQEGQQAYAVIYFENSLSDVRLEPFEALPNLDDIPEIDFDKDNIIKYLQVNDASIKKLDRDKLGKDQATTVATPNKLLYLNNAGKLDATATNSDKFNGLTVDQFSLKNDLTTAPYVKTLSVSGTTITYTKGDGSSGTIKTQDTNDKVKNELNNTVKAYLTGTTSAVTNTGTQVFDTGVYLGTTPGELIASRFVGDFVGGSSEKADIADKDRLGQFIDTTYIKNLSSSGTKITFTKGDGSTSVITTQDTNDKVTNTLNTNTKAYLTGTTSAVTNTGTQVFDTGVYLSTFPGELIASRFIGDFIGNADSATKATQDNLSQNIDSTYIKSITYKDKQDSNGRHIGSELSISKGNNSKSTITIPDTNDQVKNELNNTVKAYLTGTTSAVTNTGTQVFDTGVYLGTTPGELIATKFSGKLVGNADSATKATNDGAGNNIVNTYAKKTDIPSVWDSSGHLVSPAGWKMWVEN